MPVAINSKKQNTPHPLIKPQHYLPATLTFFDLYEPIIENDHKTCLQNCTNNVSVTLLTINHFVLATVFTMVLVTVYLQRTIVTIIKTTL